MSCASMAQNQPVLRKILQRAEEQQYEPKLCSFLKSTIGGIYEGIMPKPDLVIGSPGFCSSMGSILENVSRYYNSDFFYLNIPLNYSPDAVSFLAKQLRKLTVILSTKSGMSIKEVENIRLPGSIELSNQAAKYWKQIETLRQNIPSPMSGSEAIDYATVLSQTWGSNKIVEIYKLLYTELNKRVENKVPAIPNETLRILWLHLRPYYPNKIFDILESYGAVIAFEEVNFPSRNRMDPSHPYLSLAQEILSNIGKYRNSVIRANDIVYIAEKFKVNGVIHFAHENCDYSKVSFPVVFELLQRGKGIPILNLNSDCLVDEHSELLKTRLQAFLEGLRAKQIISNKSKTVSKIQKRSLKIKKDCFMGIDVGAAFTKAIVLNHNGKEDILGWSILPTGSDNSKAIEYVSRTSLEMAGNLSIDNCKIVIATGVGRENVSFANKKITEIICHISGMRHFFPDVKTIVDIGGQDSKVILTEELSFRMNDACAAGTGKFLAAMAEALGISLEELSRCDSSAKKSLILSRMCTVFAESEVVNLVAKGSQIDEIVRGIHDMVADKTVTLLRQLSPNIISPVAMSGGVALNDGVIRALERRLDEKILIPKKPQLIGALGAAIIASQNDVIN
jgi:predicted CoA-substrate-specific enzyme activase